DLETEVLAGSEALSTIVAEPEVTTVMAAIVGGAGLQPTLAAVSAGKTVLLANKESLVMAGPLFMETVRNNGGQLLPIDSEQNAMFQSLPGFKIGQSLTNLGVEKLWLTASGGPFLTSPLSELESVTPEQACAHPNWEMGRKISVDSATMMNKGLEVIETAWFFGVDGAQIEVVVHPQSVIHSLVEYCDGSTLAQLGSADMRIPIAHALAWPERMFSGAARLDLRTVGSLDFQPVDLLKFPCLRLAYEALAAGGSVPAQMNAANEVAVESFLQGGVQFLQIAQVVEEVLQRLSGRPLENLESVLAVDDEARDTALMVIQGLNS
ncbi:MAG TPA: 1-deoxy-D-xylulose-5-phosphate reductoisomerase, partial [Gammaproteobacteria bacterium]|nr:1-deoxy-D-xylulose-5-phosphate reductoisomerase [Gammaproteobacteria bacterium]